MGKFEEGRDAFLAEEYPCDNPYVEGTPSAQEWEDGWRDAYDDYLKARTCEYDGFLSSFSGFMAMVLVLMIVGVLYVSFMG